MLAMRRGGRLSRRTAVPNSGRRKISPLAHRLKCSMKPRQKLLALLGFKVWNAYGRIESPAVEFISPGETSLGEMQPEP